MGCSTADFPDSKGYRYFINNSRIKNDIPSPESVGLQDRLASAATEPTLEQPRDIFGLLPSDIQIEILGYIAVYSPAQVVRIRRVCKLWNEILRQDSIYHSALLTASFSHPLGISRKAFEKAAFTDHRIRNVIFSKAKGYSYRGNPKSLVYRDGFLVSYSVAGNCFTCVDLNQAKPATERHTIKTKPTKFLRAPIYTLGGGSLVYTMSSEEAASKKESLSLHAVRLGKFPKRGKLNLPNLLNLQGPLELYCSRSFALVLRNLEILVTNIADITAMKVIRIIPLHEHTYLSFPVIKTIKISNNGHCLVILAKGDSVEVLTFLLNTGALLRRYSTDCQLRDQDQVISKYAQRYPEFALDTQCQIRSTTHKEYVTPSYVTKPPQSSFPQSPAIEESKDGGILGPYTGSTNQPPRHSVTFQRQGLNFSAFEDNDYSECTVGRQCLKITKGYLGTRSQDFGPTDVDVIAPLHPVNISMTGGTASWWSPPATTSPPSHCITTDGENTTIHTDLWVENRKSWPETGILLGDERALILALPHQLVIWKFQMFQTWRDRKKNRIKYHARDMAGACGITLIWVVMSPGIVVSLPIIAAIICCIRFDKRESEEVVPVATIYPPCHHRPAQPTHS